MFRKIIPILTILFGASQADFYGLEAALKIVKTRNSQQKKQHIPHRELLKTKLKHSSVWTPQLEKELIHGRVGVHFLYDDLILLLDRLENEFSDIVTITSIGKTFQNRDIPLITIALPGKIPISERPALLMTGAHHSRELTSTAIVISSLLRNLHGIVHKDRETVKMFEN
jgi:hypothetical protein